MAGDWTRAHHVFTTLHEFLINDLAGKVFPSMNVDGFLDHGVGATAKGFACAILRRANGEVVTRMAHRREQLHRTRSGADSMNRVI